MGPAGPLISLIAGALFGSVLGGTAGGVYTCTVEGDHYVIKYLPEYHHPPPGQEYQVTSDTLKMKVIHNK